MAIFVATLRRVALWIVTPSLAIAVVVFLLRTPFAAGFWIHTLGAARGPQGNEWGLAHNWPWEGRGWPTAALRQIGPAAVPACIDALHSEDANERYGGALALALYGAAARPAIPALVATIQDDRSFGGAKATALEIRRASIDAILQSGTGVAEARQLLRRFLRQPVQPDREVLIARSVYSSPDPDARVRRIWAAYGLAWLEPADAEMLQIFTDGLTYVDVYFRAVHWKTYRDTVPLSESGMFTVDGLAGYYFNREASVHYSVLSALSGLGFGSRLSAIDEAYLPPLVSALVQVAARHERGDGNVTERQSALTVLEKLGPRASDAAPALAAALRNAKDYQLRQSLISALRMIDPSMAASLPEP